MTPDLYVLGCSCKKVLWHICLFVFNVSMLDVWCCYNMEGESGQGTIYIISETRGVWVSIARRQWVRYVVLQRFWIARLLKGERA